MSRFQVFYARLPGISRRQTFLHFTLAGTLILWAAAFVAIPIALQTVEAAGVIAGRLAISSLIFLPFLARDWKRVIRPRLAADWHLILAMAFFGVTLYMLALVFGQRTVGAGTSSLIVNLTPLMTGAFATVFLKERFHPRLILGGLIALGGVTLLVTSKGAAFSFDPNALLVVLATASASLFYIIQRRLTAHYSALTLSALSVVLGAALFAPFTAGAWGALGAASRESALAIVFLGLFSGVIPYIGWAYVLSRLPAAKATLYLYFVPVIATALGWLVLGETVTWLYVGSAAVIIFGVIIGSDVLVRLWAKPKTPLLLPPKRRCPDAP